MAETLEDFEDLVRLFTMLDGREASGPRLAAISNAGFESVAFADNIGGLRFAKLNVSSCRATRLPGVWSDWMLRYGE